jgi:hypothetical protein
MFEVLCVGVLQAVSNQSASMRQTNTTPEKADHTSICNNVTVITAMIVFNTKILIK